MRAIVCETYTGYQDLKLRNIEPPALRAGCVRIAVHYCCIGFGTSLIVAGRYQRKPPLPFVPGTEVSGFVTEVAADVSHLQIGDRVTGIIDWGGYADQAVGTADTVWKIPEQVPLDLACLLPAAYGTPWAALHWRAKLQAGESVLVFGAAGGVGRCAVELARLAGAHVIAVARDEERLQVALDHGAHEGWRSDTPDLGRMLKQRHGGRGIDVVFDPVGGECFDQALKAIAPEGRILVIGFAGGTIPQVPANLLLVKNAAVIGVNLGLYTGWTPGDDRKAHAPKMQQMIASLSDLIIQGKLRPAAPTVFPLERTVEGFEALVARRHTGRMLIQVADQR